jgi:hypothetical protein
MNCPSVRNKLEVVDMSNRVIAVQNSKIAARLSVTRRSGSPESFKLMLESIGEAMAAGASVEVAMEYARDAQKDRTSMPAKPMICAMTAKPIIRKKEYAR